MLSSKLSSCLRSRLINKTKIKKNVLQFVSIEKTLKGHFFLSCFPPRALNEMWKCQNLLRNHVKDLLDLIKKPKVTD